MEKIEELKTPHPFEEINWKDITNIQHYMDKHMKVDLSLCDGTVHKLAITKTGLLNTPSGFKIDIIKERIADCKLQKKEISKKKDTLNQKKTDLATMLILKNAQGALPFDVFLECLIYLENCYKQKYTAIQPTFKLYEQEICKYKEKYDELQNLVKPNEPIISRWSIDLKAILDY